MSSGLFGAAVRLRTDNGPAIPHDDLKDVLILLCAYSGECGAGMYSIPTNEKASRARVLIVDDQPDVAKLLAMLLERRGYEVEVEVDGTQCLSHLESFNPEVVFLDIGMPKVCGYDLARQIRTQPEFERVAIIAISGYGDDEHEARSLESGCDQHLVKPVKLATLEAAIAREVRKRLQ